MRCELCGVESAPGAASCPGCGAALDRVLHGRLASFRVMRVELNEWVREGKCRPAAAAEIRRLIEERDAETRRDLFARRRGSKAAPAGLEPSAPSVPEDIPFAEMVEEASPAVPLPAVPPGGTGMPTAPGDRARRWAELIAEREATAAASARSEQVAGGGAGVSHSDRPRQVAEGETRALHADRSERTTEVPSSPVSSRRDATGRIEGPEPEGSPSVPLSERLAALMSERNVRWLLNLGILLISVGAAVYIHSQWKSWSPPLQCGILAGITLALFGAGAALRKGTILSATGTALVVLASISVPIDVFAAVHLGLVVVARPFLIGVVASIICAAMYLALLWRMREAVFAWLGVIAVGAGYAFGVAEAGATWATAPAHVFPFALAALGVWRWGARRGRVIPGPEGLTESPVAPPGLDNVAPGAPGASPLAISSAPLRGAPVECAGEPPDSRLGTSAEEPPRRGGETIAPVRRSPQGEGGGGETPGPGPGTSASPGGAAEVLRHVPFPTGDGVACAPAEIPLSPSVMLLPACLWTSALTAGIGLVWLLINWLALDELAPRQPLGTLAYGLGGAVAYALSFAILAEAGWAFTAAVILKMILLGVLLVAGNATTMTWTPAYSLLGTLCAAAGAFVLARAGLPGLAPEGEAAEASTEDAGSTGSSDPSAARPLAPHWVFGAFSYLGLGLAALGITSLLSLVNVTFQSISGVGAVFETTGGFESSLNSCSLTLLPGGLGFLVGALLTQRRFFVVPAGLMLSVLWWANLPIWFGALYVAPLWVPVSPWIDSAPALTIGLGGWRLFPAALLLFGAADANRKDLSSAAVGFATAAHLVALAALTLFALETPSFLFGSARNLALGSAGSVFLAGYALLAFEIHGRSSSGLAATAGGFFSLACLYGLASAASRFGDAMPHGTAALAAGWFLVAWLLRDAARQGVTAVGQAVTVVAAGFIAHRLFIAPNPEYLKLFIACAVLSATYVGWALVFSSRAAEVVAVLAGWAAAWIGAHEFVPDPLWRVPLRSGASAALLAVAYLGARWPRRPFVHVTFVAAFLVQVFTLLVAVFFSGYAAPGEAWAVALAAGLFALVAIAATVLPAIVEEIPRPALATWALLLVAAAFAATLRWQGVSDPIVPLWTLGLATAFLALWAIPLRDYAAPGGVLGQVALGLALLWTLHLARPAQDIPIAVCAWISALEVIVSLRGPVRWTEVPACLLLVVASWLAVDKMGLPLTSGAAALAAVPTMFFIVSWTYSSRPGRPFVVTGAATGFVASAMGIIVASGDIGGWSSALPMKAAAFSAYAVLFGVVAFVPAATAGIPGAPLLGIAAILGSIGWGSILEHFSTGSPWGPIGYWFIVPAMAAAAFALRRGGRAGPDLGAVHGPADETGTGIRTSTERQDDRSVPAPTGAWTGHAAALGIVAFLNALFSFGITFEHSGPEVRIVMLMADSILAAWLAYALPFAPCTWVSTLCFGGAYFSLLQYLDVPPSRYVLWLLGLALAQVVGGSALPRAEARSRNPVFLIGMVASVILLAAQMGRGSAYSSQEIDTAIWCTTLASIIYASAAWLQGKPAFAFMSAASLLASWYLFAAVKQGWTVWEPYTVPLGLLALAWSQVALRRRVTIALAGSASSFDSPAGPFGKLRAGSGGLAQDGRERETRPAEPVAAVGEVSTAGDAEVRVGAPKAADGAGCALLLLPSFMQALNPDRGAHAWVCYGIALVLILFAMAMRRRLILLFATGVFILEVGVKAIHFIRRLDLGWAPWLIAGGVVIGGLAATFEFIRNKSARAKAGDFWMRVRQYFDGWA